MKFLRKMHGARRGICLLLAVVILTGVLTYGGVLPADAAYTDSTVKKYQSQIAALEQKSKDLKKNINDLRSQAAEYRELKKEYDGYIATVEEKIETSELYLVDLQEEIGRTKAEIAAKKDEYARKRKQFLDTMTVNYEEGGASYLALLLGATSLSDFLSRLERLTSILEYQKSITTRLDAIRISLEEKQASLEEQVEEQNDILAALAVDKADLEQKRKEVDEMILELQKNEVEIQNQIKKNQTEEAKLDSQMQAYIQEQQRLLQLKMEAGDWRWPIDLNVTQVCSSGYGWRILYGVWDFHRGWDIACAKGTPIHAAKGGRVLYATYHYSYGNYVVIDNGDGVSTVYGHCTKLYVTAGQTVKKGDVIGTVGTTGNSTGFHLHFEFRKNGLYTDPFNYIKSPPIPIIASRLTK